MNLRQWQSDCISRAMEKYSSNSQHFLCLATPGAGKTLMASVLARTLFQQNLIDLVLCFSPSILVATDFQSALEVHTDCRMDGLLGSKGRSLTYQSMLSLSDDFWTILDTHRVFIIFDEIHHCAGHCLENANAWGDKIIRHIQGRAAYTLALTGTPWRSDKIPIALSSYCQDKKIFCDFMYGLKQAVQDKACRIPRITLIDNDCIHIKQGNETQKYSSFAELLKLSQCSYQQLIDNEDLIVYLLKQSSKKLSKIRKDQMNAGGLIVAATVEHAHKIAELLYRHLGEKAAMATYMEDDAQQIINSFRQNTEKWIISVGMISEGTNIPRLRVCCHLTRVKTELNFRQILGRILRVSHDEQGESFLYIPAEPSLIEYAHRVAEEIPESMTINFEVMTARASDDVLSIQVDESSIESSTSNVVSTIKLAVESKLIDKTDQQKDSEHTQNGSSLAASYDATVDIFGRFKQELLNFNQLYG